MSKKDHEAIEAAIRTILTQHRELERTQGDDVARGMIQIDCRRLYNRLELQNLARRRIMDAVSDALSSSSICHEFGMWVLAEVEMTNCVLVRLPVDKRRIVGVVAADDGVGAAIVNANEAFGMTQFGAAPQ